MATRLRVVGLTGLVRGTSGAHSPVGRPGHAESRLRALAWPVRVSSGAAGAGLGAPAPPLPFREVRQRSPAESSWWAVDPLPSQSESVGYTPTAATAPRDSDTLASFIALDCCNPDLKMF